MDGCKRRKDRWSRERRNGREEFLRMNAEGKPRRILAELARDSKTWMKWIEGGVRGWEEGREMDERQVGLIKRRGSSFLIDGGSATQPHTQRHSQALDYALQLESLAPESVVSAVASSGSHHLGPPVPHHRVGWRKRRTHRDEGETIHTYGWDTFRSLCC